MSVPAVLDSSTIFARNRPCKCGEDACMEDTKGAWRAITSITASVQSRGGSPSARLYPVTELRFNYPSPPNLNRNPVSALYKIRTCSTPSKGAFFPSNQCHGMENRVTFGAASTQIQLSVGGWCGDYNANFSIVGRVVLLH
jgi:hypothetical protein